jgi:hypothetical protein
MCIVFFLFDQLIFYILKVLLSVLDTTVFMLTEMVYLKEAESLLQQDMIHQDIHQALVLRM